MKTSSLSRKLLTRVLSFYFVLTFLVTCIQIGAEYVNTKNHITSELLILEKTFSGSLTRAVWELNSQQAIDIADGLIAIPMVKSITIRDENQQLIHQSGEIFNNETLSIKALTEGFSDDEHFIISSQKEGLFGHSFPLIFEFSGRTTKVGTVTLLSNNEVIFDRISVGIYFLIGNAMLKTAALMLLFSIAFSQLLTNPLNELTDQINQFDINDPEASKLNILNYEKNELNILQNAYNNLIDELILYKEKLTQAQNKLVSANNKLDEQNMMLEQEVARKTSSLSSAMLEMETQQKELLEQQDQLKAEIERRTQTENTLIKTNNDLKHSIIALNKAQERLLETEKMAALGQISAEISHEVNTPLGISFTSTSYLSDLLLSLQKDISSNNLSKRTLNDYTKNSEQALELVTNNLKKASELMLSFKQVAVDQVSDKIRKVNIYKYLTEIIKSLQPKLKKTNHIINIECDNNIEIYCHAGAISQIFTNLIINSIIHGFKEIDNGIISIKIQLNGDSLHINYKDNGRGLTATELEKLFDAFYTTAGNEGGSGLGTHIIKDLVEDTLNGTIHATSTVSEGLQYDITFDNMM